MPPRRALLAALLGGCTARPTTRPAAAPRPGPKIEVVRRDWHTDLALPAAPVFEALPTLARPFAGASHLIIGFGDRAYLLAEQSSVMDALGALLGGGPGAMLVTGLAQPAAHGFPAKDTIAIPTSAEGVSGATRFIAASFERDAAGAPRLLRQGPYPGSLFYGSVRRYSARYTCNTWTADGLRHAGLPIDPDGIVFTDGVMSAAERLAAG